MGVVVKKMQETNVTCEQIVSLMHESFKEREEQGLKYTCSYMDAETYQKKAKNGIVLVAIDENSGELYGTGMVHIYTNKWGAKYGYIENLAVSPEKKRLGIGSLLLRERIKFIEESGGEYVLSDTAIGAESAVKYHKKNGFKIVGLRSYKTTNYYSYLFRLQLRPSLVWNNNVLVKFIFSFSYIKTKIKFTRNGEKRMLYNLFCKVRKSICKR